MKINSPIGNTPSDESKLISENEFELDIREFNSQMPANLVNGHQAGTPLTTTTTISLIKYSLLLKC